MNRILALLLAAVMLLGLLAGCGSNSQSSLAASGAADVSVPGAVAADDVSQADDETAHWLSDETQTITVWDTWPAFFTTFDEAQQSPADTTLLQALEQRFNIKFDLTIANTEAASELFNIMAASGDYCDLIYGVSSHYVGGIEKAVNDGIIVDAKPIIEESSPNYAALLENKDIARSLTTDTGIVGGYAMINTERAKRTTGGLIRGDWLEQLNMEVPETTDEFYQTLCAFRDEMGASGALCVSSTGGFGSVSAAFAPIGLYVDNGTVKYGTDTLKDYYTYVHKLYTEGLIPQDFMTYTESQKAPTELVVSGATGVITDDYNNFVKYYEESMTDGGYFVALPDLVQNKGDTSIYQQIYSYIDSSNYVSISTQCSDPNMVGTVLDYCFSEEGQILGDYGIEGYTFDYDENGTPQYSEMITNNPNGAPSGISVLIYLDGCWPHLRNNDRLLYSLNERELACRQDWDTCYTSNEGTYPSSDVSFTNDELNVIGTYETVLDTYMDEYYLRFLTGASSVEEDFDAFIAGLESYHIDELLTAYQSAYDRYLER